MSTERQKPCGFCDGTGKVHASREMALDAGDAQLEGAAIACWFCKGDGFTVEASDTPAAAEATPDVSQSELLDAIEGLLITFVYENPLPPDLEATTRDAHIGVAEELLIHHGRERFVQSRVDRVSHDAELSKLREALRGLVNHGDNCWCVDAPDPDDVEGHATYCAAARTAMGESK